MVNQKIKLWRKCLKVFIHLILKNGKKLQKRQKSSLEKCFNLILVFKLSNYYLDKRYSAQ